jgi:uncharacterized protein (DUF433 family)
MQGSQHALRRITRPEFRRTMPQHPRILRRSDVWGGKAVVAGTRIPVFMLASRLQSGWTEETLLDEYPRLTSEDVQAVVRYVECFPARVIADRRSYERSLPTERA